jgi:hypothetical protein
MIEEFGYLPYRPAGYTDDLGIIAEVNQWAPAQTSGWYFRVTSGNDQVRSWLDDNEIRYTYEGWKLIIHTRNHAMMFKLRFAYE